MRTIERVLLGVRLIGWVAMWDEGWVIEYELDEPWCGGPAGRGSERRIRASTFDSNEFTPVRPACHHGLRARSVFSNKLLIYVFDYNRVKKKKNTKEKNSHTSFFCFYRSLTWVILYMYINPFYETHIVLRILYAWSVFP